MGSEAEDCEARQRSVSSYVSVGKQNDRMLTKRERWGVALRNSNKEKARRNIHLSGG